MSNIFICVKLVKPNSYIFTLYPVKINVFNKNKNVPIEYKVKVGT